MRKEDYTQNIYNVNEYYFRLHNDKTFINEQIDFIYYSDQNIWYVYGSDFNNNKIDIGILTTEQVNEIRNWDIITKSKLFRYLLENKTPNNNEQSITYQKDIIELFLAEEARDKKLSQLGI